MFSYFFPQIPATSASRSAQNAGSSPVFSQKHAASSEPQKAMIGYANGNSHNQHAAGGVQVEGSKTLKGLIERIRALEDEQRAIRDLLLRTHAILTPVVEDGARGAKLPCSDVARKSTLDLVVSVLALFSGFVAQHVHQQQSQTNRVEALSKEQPILYAAKEAKPSPGDDSESIHAAHLPVSRADTLVNLSGSTTASTKASAQNSPALAAAAPPMRSTLGGSNTTTPVAHSITSMISSLSMLSLGFGGDSKSSTDSAVRASVSVSQDRGRIEDKDELDDGGASSPAAPTLEHDTTTATRMSSVSEGMSSICTVASDESDDMGVMAQLRRTVLAELRTKGLCRAFAEKYSIVREIGGGSYGVVFKARRRSITDLGDKTSEPVYFAVKIGMNSRVPDGFWARDLKHGRVPREVAVLQRLNHPHIISVVDYFSSNGMHFIVTPLVGDVFQDAQGNTYRPDLFDALKLVNAFAEPDARELFAQVAAAIKYMHERGYVHQDLKDENILLDRAGRAVLVDFGSACRIDGADLPDSSGVATMPDLDVPLDRELRFTKFWGTDTFAAPECLVSLDNAENRDYGGGKAQGWLGRPADVWALGVLLYLLLTGRLPFETREATIADPLLLPSWAIISRSAQNLLARMLDKNPTTRADIFQVTSHPWITGTTRHAN